MIKAVLGPARLHTEIDVRGHHLVADEETAVGGEDAGPSPTELVLSGLSACTAITLRMYANRKAWPLQGVYVEVAFDGSAAARRIVRTVTVLGPLDDEQRDRLLEIANACPVHKLLSGGISVDTTLRGGS